MSDITILDKSSPLAKRNEYDFSVIVVTYNPSLEKFLRTLSSVVCQKCVSFEVVVCDDGSRENYFEDAKIFFERNHFTNYRLIANPKNQGTVKNLLSGLEVAKGKYIKTISPGDFLYDENALYNVYQVIKKSDAKIFFGKAFYYSYENGEITIHNLRNPRNLKPYMESDYKKIRKNYILMQDYILGADLITERISTYAYMTEISGFVKYAEDCTYIYMIANGEKPVYMDIPLLWYEYGSGISTNENSEWLNKIWNDIKNTFDLLRKKNLVSLYEYFVFFKGMPFIKKHISILFHISFKYENNYSNCISALDFDISKLKEIIGD